LYHGERGNLYHSRGLGNRVCWRRQPVPCAECGRSVLYITRPASTACAGFLGLWPVTNPVVTIDANRCNMFLLVAEPTVTLASLSIGGCLRFFTLPSSRRRRLQRYCFSQGLHKGVRVAVVGATRPMQKRPPRVGSWGVEASRKERENVRLVKTFDSKRSTRHSPRELAY
jgi:hypothetical protein